MRNSGQRRTVGAWTDRSDEELSISDVEKFSDQQITEIRRAIDQGALVPAKTDPFVFRRRDVAAWIEDLRTMRLTALDSSGWLCSLARDGHVRFQGILGPSELDVLKVACDQLLSSPSDHATRFVYKPALDGQPVLERVRDVQDCNPVFRALFSHSLLQQIGSKMIGNSFIVYSASLVIKVPLIGICIPVHRDPTWTTRHTSDPVISVAFYLDDSNDENGAVYFLSGSHLPCNGRAIDLPGQGEAWWESAECGNTAAGDAVVHNLGVIHGSRENKSPGSRRTLYLSLMSVREARTSCRWDETWIHEREALARCWSQRRSK